MKALTALFSASVLGIIVCLGMTIYTGISESRSKALSQQNNANQLIPVPALSE